VQASTLRSHQLLREVVAACDPRLEANLSGVPERALPANARASVDCERGLKERFNWACAHDLESALRQGETDVAVFAKFQRAGWEIVVFSEGDAAFELPVVVGIAAKFREHRASVR
jgi:hypothetical protein